MSPRFTVTASAACPNREVIISAATGYLAEAGLDVIPSDLLKLVRSVLPMNFEDAFELRLTCHVASKESGANMFPVLLLSAATLSLEAVAQHCIQNSKNYDPSTTVFRLHVSLVPAQFRKGGVGTKAVVTTVTPKETKPVLDSSSDDDRYANRGRGGGYGNGRGMSDFFGRGGRRGGLGTDAEIEGDNNRILKRGRGRGRDFSDSEDERRLEEFMRNIERAEGGRGRMRPGLRKKVPSGRGGWAHPARE